MVHLHVVVQNNGLWLVRSQSDPGRMKRPKRMTSLMKQQKETVRLKLWPGKLEQVWSGPYTISKMLPMGLYKQYLAENILWQLKTEGLLSSGTVTLKHQHFRRDKQLPNRLSNWIWYKQCFKEKFGGGGGGNPNKRDKVLLMAVKI